MIKTGVIIMTLFGFLYAGWFSNMFDNTPTAPITVPIDLSKVGSTVEIKMIVKDEWNYQCCLLFYYTFPEHHEIDNFIENFVGTTKYRTDSGSPIYSGTPVPIKLSIYKIDNKKKQLLSSHTYLTIASIASGGNNSTGYYLQRLIHTFKFEKGKYILKIENLKGFSRLQDSKVQFSISMARKYK